MTKTERNREFYRLMSNLLQDSLENYLLSSPREDHNPEVAAWARLYRKSIERFRLKSLPAAQRREEKKKRRRS